MPTKEPANSPNSEYSSEKIEVSKQESIGVYVLPSVDHLNCGLGQFSVIEINLTDASNTQIHQLNGYVQVSMPVPSNINVNSGKAITVYRLEDDGSLTRCQTLLECADFCNDKNVDIFLIKCVIISM